ncbi:MAG TPA: hypothetical protein VGS12_11075 [Caulobacteraceae bacterium]|nr:hypothetical protein [Caulobacteraceae bacterium]
MTQIDLFPAPPPEPAVTAPQTEDVRARITKVMGALALTGGPGWTAKETAYWRTVLPQMANWLPPAERDAVRAEFERLTGTLP